MLFSKKKILTFVCVCAIFFASTIYNSNDAFGSFRRILYTPEEELEQMKNDFGCISRLDKLIYVHIPKTGGSTFEYSELMQDAVDDNVAGLRKRLHGHHHIWQLKSNAEERGIDDFHTAATIRHPCSRFISAFRYLKSDICNGGDRAMLPAFGLDTTDSVDEYVKYLDETHWEKVYLHFVPQYPWILNQNEDTVEVDNILCNEQWDEGIHRIKSVVGVEEMDTRRLFNYRGLGSTSDHIFQNHHEKCQDLKPETRESLERFYAMDYCLFGYDELPSDEDDTCIGTDNNAESMTKRFHECQEKLGEGVRRILRGSC